jgi:hypothetical protein
MSREVHVRFCERPVVESGRPTQPGWYSATCHRQARNGRSLASCRISIVLDLEGAARPTQTTAHFAAECHRYPDCKNARYLESEALRHPATGIDRYSIAL